MSKEFIRAISSVMRIGRLEMIFNLLLTLLIVVPLCGVMAYQSWLNQQTTLAWMRLHSQSLNLSSLSIDKPEPKYVRPPIPPRQVHKMSIPVPMGGLSREKVVAPAGPGANG
jgi:hypothetical protein